MKKETSGGQRIIRDEEGLTLAKQEGNEIEISIDVFTKTNPDSVYSLLGGKNLFIKDKMDRLPDEFKERDPYEFRKEVSPSPTLNKLRIAFWTEYDNCFYSGTKMQMFRVVKGICSLNTLKTLVSDPINLGWILTPVQSYHTGVQDVLETCLYKMREGLENMSVSSAKELTSIMKIYEAFDKRVHGDYRKEVNINNVRPEEKNPIDAANLLEDHGIGVINGEALEKK